MKGGRPHNVMVAHQNRVISGWVATGVNAAGTVGVVLDLFQPELMDFAADGLKCLDELSLEAIVPLSEITPDCLFEITESEVSMVLPGIILAFSNNPGYELSAIGFSAMVPCAVRTNKALVLPPIPGITEFKGGLGTVEFLTLIQQNASTHALLPTPAGAGERAYAVPPPDAAAPLRSAPAAPPPDAAAPLPDAAAPLRLGPAAPPPDTAAPLGSPQPAPFLATGSPASLRKQSKPQRVTVEGDTDDEADAAATPLGWKRKRSKSETEKAAAAQAFKAKVEAKAQHFLSGVVGPGAPMKAGTELHKAVMKRVAVLKAAQAGSVYAEEEAVDEEAGKDAEFGADG